ncbi:hypothetical protein HanPI659440_Chr02g0081821 [Helianthus annuus]|nr:hypothetical protein HanPI659440_Chr02g0081821 [Helianthus annuus]
MVAVNEGEAAVAAAATMAEYGVVKSRGDSVHVVPTVEREDAEAGDVGGADGAGGFFIFQSVVSVVLVVFLFHPGGAGSPRGAGVADVLYHRCFVFACVEIHTWRPDCNFELSSYAVIVDNIVVLGSDSSKHFVFRQLMTIAWQGWWRVGF